MQYSISHKSRIYGPAALLAAAGLLAVVATSCGPHNASPPAVREEGVQVPDAPPAEMLLLAQESAGEASRLAEKLAEGHSPPTVPDELRTHLFTGIKAADKLLTDPAAEDAQREAAVETKLALLKTGVARRLIPMSRLQTCADQLVEQSPDSELAAAAEAALFEIDRLAGDPPPEQVSRLLFEFAEAHPNSKAGLELTARMAEKLAAAGHRKEAIQLYQIALSRYSERPEVEAMEARLGELAEAEAAARAAQTARAQLAAAEMAALQRQFGGHANGYFVVYSEENVKPPRHGGIYFYHYEYEVLKGLTAAVAYARALPEKWSWQLVQRFPETPQGREQAYALWRSLLRKKKTGKS